MRWGEPTRLPPLRRGRGLAAAALLTVGLVAAYAILGVLSLTSVAPSFLGGIPSSIGGIVKPGAVPTVTPKVQDYVASPSAPDLSALVVDLGVGAGTSEPLSNTFDLQNTAVTPVDISVGVTGALGVQAAFPDNSSTERLAAGKTTRVTVTSDPMHAGPLDGGRVVISIAGVAKPLTVPLTGAQAPLPPGAVTATPQAKGAVHVTWPASPSTGVAGYEVDRRLAGGSWQTLDASAPAGGIVDQTGPDGQTVEYRASAVTAGVQPALLSLPGAPGSAVPDATAPDLPTGVTPQDVNLANENAVPVQVDLPPTSAPTDVVSVTLTDTAGVAATGTASGGPSPAVVVVDASRLSDGTSQVGGDGHRCGREFGIRRRPGCDQGHPAAGLADHCARPRGRERRRGVLGAGDRARGRSRAELAGARPARRRQPDCRLVRRRHGLRNDAQRRRQRPPGRPAHRLGVDGRPGREPLGADRRRSDYEGHLGSRQLGQHPCGRRRPEPGRLRERGLCRRGHGHRPVPARHRCGRQHRRLDRRAARASRRRGLQVRRRAARPDRSPRRAAAARGHGHRPGRELQHDDRQRHEGHRRARGPVLVHGA